MHYTTQLGRELFRTLSWQRTNSSGIRYGIQNEPKQKLVIFGSYGTRQWHLTLGEGISLWTSISWSREKFEPISSNPYLSIINWLFNEIIRLFLEFLLEIENFIEISQISA
jgi:hypothetical protein